MALSTKFADQGTVVSVISFDDETIKDQLKPAVYSVGFNMMTGYYLNKVGDKLNTPNKVYGRVGQRVEKIMTSYNAATSSFGVLMSGDKGSGKTMTSSMVANRAIEELNLPVILVEDSFDPSSLASFIQKIGECVLFFDEFGKRFNDKQGEQGELLSLMDGTGSCKRLVMLTENERSDINRYMLNRPGRLHYHFQYGKLDLDTIEEFCKEHELEEEVIQKIHLRCEMSREFSFDVLQALVKEYKLYGGDIDKLALDLNIESIHAPKCATAMVLSVIDQSIGEEVAFHEVPTAFPNAFTNTRIPLDNGDKDKEFLEEDEPFDPLHDCECLFFNMKNLVHKEGDIYTFKVPHNDKTYLVKVLKEGTGHGGYLL